MPPSRSSSDFLLIPLPNPHHRDERTESRTFTDDHDNGRGGGNGGGGFQLPQMPPPRRWSPGKVRRPARLFERPKWGHLCLHTFLCVASYPIIYVGTILARDRSLFWARVIVGLWCAGVGTVIGWSLLAYASRFLEAASESQTSSPHDTVVF